MKAMNIGAMRKRLSFQSKSGDKNSFGEQTTWQEYYACWGSVDILKAQLQYSTQQFVEKTTYTISIRYPKGVVISPEHRIICDGDVFEIEAVINKERRNRELQILAYVVNDTE